MNDPGEWVDLDVMWQALQLESERTGQSTSELIRQAVTLRLALVAVNPRGC